MNFDIPVVISNNLRQLEIFEQGPDSFITSQGSRCEDFCAARFFSDGLDPTSEEIISGKKAGFVQLLTCKNFCPPVVALQRSLFEMTGASINTNAYFSSPFSKGLPLHSDDTYILVFQLTGKKKWRVANQLKLTPSQTARISLGSFPHKEFDLQEGQWLLMKPFTPHFAENVFDTPSLHLTMSFEFPKSSDILRFITDYFRENDTRLLITENDGERFLHDVNHMLKELTGDFMRRWTIHAAQNSLFPIRELPPE